MTAEEFYQDFSKSEDLNKKAKECITNILNTYSPDSILLKNLLKKVLELKNSRIDLLLNELGILDSLDDFEDEELWSSLQIGLHPYYWKKIRG